MQRVSCLDTAIVKKAGSRMSDLQSLDPPRAAAVERRGAPGDGGDPRARRPTRRAPPSMPPTDGNVLLVPASTASTARSAPSPPSRTPARSVAASERWSSAASHRARIGVGVPGLGRALVVEVEPVDESEPTERSVELAREYTAVIEEVLDRRGARGIAAALKGLDDPGQIADIAGYSPDLDHRAEGRGPGDRRRRGPAREGPRLGQADPGRPVAEGAHPHRGLRRHGEAAARVPPAPAAGRHPQGARRGRRGRRPGRDATGPASRSPACPRRSARPCCARSTSWSALPSRAWSTGGSAPGSTPSPSCRGASAATTPSTSPRPERSSTPTTRASTT